MMATVTCFPLSVSLANLEQDLAVHPDFYTQIWI